MIVRYYILFFFMKMCFECGIYKIIQIAIKHFMILSTNKSKILRKFNDP